MIKQYGEVILKDGRRGCAVEVWDDKHFLVDVGDSPKDWATIDVTLDDLDLEEMKRKGLIITV